MCLADSKNLEKSEEWRRIARYNAREEDGSHITRILVSIVRIWPFSLS